MKQLETIIHSKKTHKAIMWLSLLYGGFAIILFVMEFYTAVWFGGSFINASEEQKINDINAYNIDFNHNEFRDSNRAFAGPRAPMTPLRAMSSPTSLLVLLSGLISLGAGFTIMSITRQHEIKKIKQDTADYLLLPDEKKVIQVLKEGGYSLPQNKITKESGLSKVQVHRVLKRLESKGLIEKHEYGLTNKIVLKKELLE